MHGYIHGWMDTWMDTCMHGLMHGRTLLFADLVDKGLDLGAGGASEVCTLLLFDGVLFADGFCDDLLVDFEDEAAHDHLVEDKVDSVCVKDDVELRDVLKASVQRLDKRVDQVEDSQVGLGRVDHKDKVQRRKVPVHNLSIFSPRRLDVLDKVAHVSCSALDQVETLVNQLLLLIH